MSEAPTEVAPTEGPIESPVDPVEAQSPLKRRLALGGVGLALAVALLGGGYILGSVTADDADQVDELESRLAALEDDLDGAQDDVSEAEAALDEVQAERSDLEEQLAAELGFEGKIRPDTSGPGPKGDFTLGQAGSVGPLIFRPTSFELTETSGNQSTYIATIGVKNDTAEPVDPFCSDGAAVVDAANRRYTGESMLALNTANCGDSVQPGLTVDNYEMKFKLPADAQPAVLELWGDFFIVDESDAKGWTLP